MCGLVGWQIESGSGCCIKQEMPPTKSTVEVGFQETRGDVSHARRIMPLARVRTLASALLQPACEGSDVWAEGNAKQEMVARARYLPSSRVRY